MPIYRSDGSGTTFNWTDYLSKRSQAWRGAVGSDMTVRWPVGAGAKGNGGVAASVARVPGSIGSVEYSDAMKANLAYALVRNRAGNFVQPSERGFRSAVLGADWTSEPDFRVLITDEPASDAYPIMATSFALVAAYPKDTARSKATQDFFRWALTDGGPMAQALGYLPLPAAMVDQVEAYWAVNRP
ncbi:MAG: substrate-binding domain-containing protein [Acetobacteraceae bacterium]